MHSILFIMVGLTATASGRFGNYSGDFPLKSNSWNPLHLSFNGIQIPLPNPVVRSGYEEPPRYSVHLKTYDDAYKAILKHLFQVNKAQFAQYIMLMYTIDYLVEGLLIKGHKWYDNNYATLVTDSISKVSQNPVEAAESVRLSQDVTRSQLAIVSTVSTNYNRGSSPRCLTSLRDLIQNNQVNCDVPVSLNCDVKIHSVILSKEDQWQTLLNRQTKHLIAVSEEKRLFMANFAAKFKKLARSKGAQSYLIDGQDDVWPLVSVSAYARVMVAPNLTK